MLKLLSGPHRVLEYPRRKAGEGAGHPAPQEKDDRKLTN